jgi:hypothetical protein
MGQIYCMAVHDITEILLKVALATMKQTSIMLILKTKTKTFYLMNGNFHLFSLAWVTLTTYSNFIVYTLLILRCNQNKHETSMCTTLCDKVCQ